MAYKPLHLVDELIQSLGSSLPPDEVEALLNKAQTNPTTPAREDCLELLKKHSKDPDAFSAKYLELKEKKSELLGPTVELLARISEDSKLQRYLRKIPTTTPKHMTNGTSKKHLNAAVTTESLSLVKSQLKAAHQELERSQHDARADRNEPQVRHNGNLEQMPTFPRWFSSRPHLSNDFFPNTNPDTRLLTLVGVSVASQESALLADMVNCLSGVDGKHVVAVPLSDPYAKRTFQFAEGTDQALQEMCSKVLVLASHHSMVTRFIEQKYDFHYGRVNNALAAAMEEHVMEYLTFVAQIETQLRDGELRLQKLLFSIQPILHIMSVLSHIAQAINNADAQGGKVLSLLHQNAVKLAGDHEGQLVCLELARSASKPYLQSLDTWLLCGIIEDPLEEFLVEDNHWESEGSVGGSLEDCDGYWEKRYMVRRERVPTFLGQHTDKILRTGKYLNVIRQCGKSVKSPQSEKSEYSFNGRECEVAIEKAYQFASKTLLDILMTEYDLKGRLKWMKHFFLLQQGDFISQFMDACESELHKPILEVEPTRLESLLGLVLRTTSAVSAMGGYYLEDLHTQLLTSSLPAQMMRILTISDTYNTSSSRMSSGTDLDEPNLTGMEGFTFQVDVKWPVSLVLNSNDLSRYQMVFRHLFFIKHVERLLCRVWSSNKVARSFPKADSPLYRPAFALRQRMLNFIQSLEYYMTSEVIEPNWHLFMEKIKKVTSVDDVLLCHSDFIDQCQRECMLTVPDLLLPLRQLLDCCTEFCSFILGAELGSDVGAENWESFEKKVARHEKNFSALLHDLLELVSRLGRDSANAKLLNVLYMLDFNGYYASQRQPQRERRATSSHAAVSG